MIYSLEKSFSCAHFYHQKKWNKEQNQKEFGLCFTEFGHGHDYTLKIEIETEDLDSAQRALQSLVNKLDHQHLNFMIPEFKEKVPTTENLGLFIQSQLEKSFSLHETKILSLKLHETPEIWIEI
jgi:6-pyruvoyltetrahydropterin/6-carboxytetrahydropterin synthase